MAFGTTTTVGTLAVISSTAAYLLRRRISRGWIDCRGIAKDLSGKTIVVSGGNVGLGYETAKDLSNRNAKVVLACRNVASGQQAAQSIAGGAPVDVMELDLASLASVRDFSVELQKKYPTIDALVCNAGVWVPMEQNAKTQDGFEIHFGVNHLGHLFLIQRLQDCIAKEDGRIVIVSSGLSKSGKLDFETQDFVREGRALQEGEKKSFAPTGYCDSKLMNALTAKHLGQAKGMKKVYAVCPGFCRSSLGRNVDMAFFKKILAVPIMRLLQRSSTQGAQNIIYCVIADNLVSGAIYADGDIAKEPTERMESLGEEAPQNLWELSDKLIKETIGK